LREQRSFVHTDRVAVIGAGVSGLVTAAELASRGVEVVVLERAEAPGGKMREVGIGEARIDAGPTVLTMRWVFDELFEAAGASFERAVMLRPAEVIARHAWSERERLDLFGDVERSADAIGVLAGSAEAQGYRRFSERARAIYETLEGPFLRARRPGVLDLVRGLGLRRAGDLWRIKPFSTLWGALGGYFRDPRLRQLFGRYATYVGSSPFLSPATLMLVAHVEREGVWLVEGGMHRVAVALARLAESCGAKLRFGAEVCEVSVSGGRASGLVLSTGERLAVDAIVSTADVAALADGRFGPAALRATPPVPAHERSLSAVTWAMVAKTEGFPLLRHTVFFSGDYAAEFTDVFRRSRLPREPTVYVCAQDRGARDGAAPAGPERLLCLVNAPATGDTQSFAGSEMERCEKRAFELLARCGLDVQRRPETTVTTTPAGFERLFPGTGGALYGRATHGWRASFQRPGPRSALPGLYLAGGSTHPGAGVPMAGLAGRMAASTVLADLASTRTSRVGATSGGTSMR
jgi:1-hydroxycarotenoid 3,4-desaturase